MAFVYRSQSGEKYTLSPGPGAYLQPQKKQIGVLSVAPFNQSSPRKLWKHTQNPGPGAYSPQLKENKPKSIFKSSASTFGVFETPIETSIFCSSSKRFQNNKQEGPGPGQYSLQPQIRPKTRTTSQSNNLQKYLQKSRIIECQDKEDSLFVIGQDTQRPIETKFKKIEKKTVPFLSQQQRAKATRPQTSLGPGSYNIQQSKQLKKEVKNRKNVSQSIIKIRKNPIEQQFQQSLKQLNKKQRQPFIKKSLKNRRQDFFGSSVSRFLNRCQNETPGPGQYDVNMNKSTQLMAPVKKAAFGRNPINKSKNEVFITPFFGINVKQGHPPQEKQANHKCKKVKQTHPGFLFKQERFKRIKESQSANYISSNGNELFLGKQNLDEKIKKKSRKACSFNKITIKHPIHQKNTDQRPLSYATQAYTISSKASEKYQIKAPFMSYVSRFQNNQKHQIKDLQGFYGSSTVSTEPKESSKAQKLVRQTPKKGIMDSVNPRFNYKQANANISPFSYNPIKPIKKQFNKLFL